MFSLFSESKTESGTRFTDAKGANDSKLKKVGCHNYTLSIGGFSQPQVFLSERAIDLQKRWDGSRERLFISCQFVMRLKYGEAKSAVKKLDTENEEKRDFITFFM